MTLPEGTNAVITGGGQGIGAAVARALAEAGAQVLVAGRTMTTLDQVVGELRGAGLPAHALRVDVTDHRSVARFAEESIEILGHVDILVNNAGQAHSAPLHRTSLEDWERMMAGNATGTFLCTKAFMVGMLERHWGSPSHCAKG